MVRAWPRFGIFTISVTPSADTTTCDGYVEPREPAENRASWLREVISSFWKTFRRWYCTVRGLMNSCAPISGFERPSRARRAIWASWGVSTARVSSLRVRAVSPVARSSRWARSANACSSGLAEHLVGGSKLLAGVDAPVLATQPLAVHEVCAGEMDGDTSALESFDRLAVQGLGSRAVAQQRA